VLPFIIFSNVFASEIGDHTWSSRKGYVHFGVLGISNDAVLEISNDDVLEISNYDVLEILNA